MSSGWNMFTVNMTKGLSLSIRMELYLVCVAGLIAWLSFHMTYRVFDSRYRDHTNLTIHTDHNLASTKLSWVDRLLSSCLMRVVVFSIPIRIQQRVSLQTPPKDCDPWTLTLCFSSAVASTIQHALDKRISPEPEHPGPFKQILGTNHIRSKVKEEKCADTYRTVDHSESLYKYINVSPLLKCLTG